MRPAVFLDRDGVLNRLVLAHGRQVAPRTLRDFSLLPGVGRAVRRLRRAGFVVIVVTNQPEIARGRLPLADLELMHLRLRSLLPVHAVYTCPHDDSDFCHCRKPLPGLLFRAAHDWLIALRDSFMVGDSWRDIAAGRAAGCHTVDLSTTAVRSGDLRANEHFLDLRRAAPMICSRRQECLGPIPSSLIRCLGLARG